MRQSLKKVAKLILIMSLIILSLICFIYTPFYSRSLLFIIEKLNPPIVNPVAAKSQQQANLQSNLKQHLEPGSVKWIARQTYLDLMWEYIQAGNAHQLSNIYAGYQALIREIELQVLNRKLKKQESNTSLALANQNVSNSSSQLKLSDKYRAFILKFMQEHPDYRKIDDEIFSDIAELYQQHGQQAPVSLQRPYAIVVLGGGLTRDKQTNQIIINKYTEQRLITTLEVVKQYQLPIVLSGVESPYMQKWLKKHGVKASLLEKKSMNTCENSRFSSLLLQKKGGAPTVILITDAYHMPRTRRLFADDGIATIPMVAPMPTALTAWQPSQLNYDHSRRANYELLASLRDKWLGSNDCREVPSS